MSVDGACVPWWYVVGGHSHGQAECSDRARRDLSPKHVPVLHSRSSLMLQLVARKIAWAASCFGKYVATFAIKGSWSNIGIYRFCARTCCHEFKELDCTLSSSSKADGSQSSSRCAPAFARTAGRGYVCLHEQ
eukprot:5915422-Amphidinium_carterae.1